MTATALHYLPPIPGNTETIGLDVAIDGLSRAWIAHSGQSPLACLTDSDGGFAQFQGAAGGETRRVSLAEPESLRDISAILRPDPVLVPSIQLRRRGNERSLSLIGLIHTMSSVEVMRAVTELTAAPIQPWDALICPSEAIRDVVRILLEDRPGKGGLPQFPVIPLGIDCAAFTGPADRGERARQRAALELDEETVLVLYHGRMSYYSKANPVPLLLAAERVAQRTGKKLALAFHGFFELPSIEPAFKEAAAKLAPSVPAQFVLHGDARFPKALWAAADIFASLADNIQESFGLTPVEAMAAGLPALVSDWDGYRASVRDGEDGFRIPTMTPAPGLGLDLAERYRDGIDVYGEYLGAAAHGTAVDVEAAAVALERLVTDEPLRQRMGEAGRKRAREVFDWSAVIPRYAALAEELADLRAKSEMNAPAEEGEPPHPDPYRLFASFPTRALEPKDRVELTTGSLEDLAQRLELRACLFHEPAVLDLDGRVRLFRFLLGTGGASVAELEQALPTLARPLLHRTIVHWLKVGLLTASPAVPHGG